MNQRIIQQIGRSQRLKVVNTLKRTHGLPVREIAAKLKMSYMGVKDICTDLEKRGFLDTWRQPQKMGRPLMLYRLTQRAHELFPVASNTMTIDLLESAQKLFGPASAEKLLLLVFQKKTEHYKSLPMVSVTAELSAFKIPDSIDNRYNAHYVDLNIYGTVNFTNNIAAG